MVSAPQEPPHSGQFGNSPWTGFRDEISLVASNGSEAVGISLWDRKEDAEAYSRTAYSEVQRFLSKVSDGTPQVQTYEVGSSTFHKVAAHAV